MSYVEENNGVASSIALSKSLISIEGLKPPLPQAIFPGLENLKVRMASCNAKANLHIHCANEECGHTETKKVVLHCFVRYSDCCYRSRFVKAKKRLQSFNIHSSRLIHLTVGFPTMPEFHKKDKVVQQKLLQKFHRMCKKAGIELKGIRVFDFQDRKEEYIHYHYALLPGNIDIRTLQKVRGELIAKTEQEFVVRIIGYRPKKSLFKYFAKRIAGCYGDFPNQFFLNQKITLLDYYKNLFNTRSLVRVSRRLSCYVVPNSFLCEVCGCKECHIEIEILSFPEDKGIDGFVGYR